MSRGFDWKTTAGVHWSKQEKDFLCGGPTNATRALLAYDLVGSKTFEDLLIELEQRGYDLTTLRFSIKKSKQESTNVTYEDYLFAKELFEPMRSIKLKSILLSLEKEDRVDTRFYEEVKREIINNRR